MVGVGVVLHLIEVIYTVAVRIGDGRIGKPTKGAKEFLPVSKAVAITVLVVVITILLRGGEGPCVYGVGMTEGTVAVCYIRSRA